MTSRSRTITVMARLIVLVAFVFSCTQMSSLNLRGPANVQASWKQIGGAACVALFTGWALYQVVAPNSPQPGSLATLPSPLDTATQQQVTEESSENVGGFLGKPHATTDAYRICEKDFSADESNLLKACKVGADYAREYVYEPYRDADEAASRSYPIVLPEVDRFRQDYLAGQTKCDRYSDAKRAELAERMACYDGYDAFAGNLVRLSDYSVDNGPDIILNNQYYEAHTYKNVYNDPAWSDGAWAYILAHRHIHPDRYPSYRRDETYRIKEEEKNEEDQTAGPSHAGGGGAHSSYVYVSTRSYYDPVIRPPAYVSGGPPPTDPVYGPSTAPRPYAQTSPWYSSAPAQPAKPSAGPSESIASHFSSPSKYSIATRSGGSVSRGGFGGTGKSIHVGGPGSGPKAPGGTGGGHGFGGGGRAGGVGG